MELGKKFIVDYNHSNYHFELFPSNLSHSFKTYRSQSNYYYVKEIHKYYYMAFCINFEKNCFYFGLCFEDEAITDNNLFLLNMSHVDPESEFGMPHQFLQFAIGQFEKCHNNLNYAYVI